MANMKMLNKSRVFKYIPDNFKNLEEFEEKTEQQFHRLFGRYMHEGEFANLRLWCRKNVNVTDTEHGYRLLLGRMGRPNNGQDIPRYVFLRRKRTGGYKEFTNIELLVGQIAAGNHTTMVASHTDSITKTIYSLELGTNDMREKRVFRTLRRAVEQGRLSAQSAARLITNMLPTATVRAFPRTAA